jgi:hypothetical protein
MFVLLVQVHAALEVASKKKLPGLPSVPRNASAGNNKKAGLSFIHSFIFP